MEAIRLIKGKEYQFNQPCIGKTEKVIYTKHTLNHYVFTGEDGEKMISSSTLKTNIIEVL